MFFFFQKDPPPLFFGVSRIKMSLLQFLSEIIVISRQSIQFRSSYTMFHCTLETSSPKGNDAHLRAIIQSEKTWKHQFFRCLRAASSVVCGRIWPNFKLIQALRYVSITCKNEKIPSRTTKKKWQHRFSNYNTICCHGNQW